MKSNPKILCFIPSLPSELRLDTLQSVFNQTVPVACTVILTEKVTCKLPFPAKISLVINNMLEDLKIENYDYLLRVDADTVLPVNFIEENLKAQCSVLGYGPAQLIEVAAFIRFMGGKLHPDHDDGYILFKFKECGLKAQHSYVVPPIVRRKDGFHQGISWFQAQGELHYRYGSDVLYELFIILGKWKRHHPYGLFILVGYFAALLKHKKLFDIGKIILARNMNKYRHPSRFLKVFTVEKYKSKMVGFVKHG